MLETERELAKLGVPVKTRHNEVAPNQYEIAPIFENSNVGSDHQQLTMQVMQNVARRYGLVCLLHEKPFAGVNGSGKHNNWSMGTDTGANLLEPGDTPHENIQFLFFCAAVIAAVNRHQALLRASVANVGQDHRLGANEAPPAIISIFLGAELEKVFSSDRVRRGRPGTTPGSFLELGTPVLPPLPMHGGDRNRTSPFAFTGNKFEFRALGSSMSLAFPNTVLNTIVAEAIDELAAQLEAADRRRDDGRRGGRRRSCGTSTAPTSRSSSAATTTPTRGTRRPSSAGWPTCARRRTRCRGSSRSRRSAPSSRYDVLSERELESRFEVFVEQYTTKLNIEAETAASIARTMILPAAVRHLAELKAAGVDALVAETEGLVDELVDGDRRARGAQRPRGVARRASSTRGTCATRIIPAMDRTRAVADRLERIVADDLWPLPEVLRRCCSSSSDSSATRNRRKPRTSRGFSSALPPVVQQGGLHECPVHRRHRRHRRRSHEEPKALRGCIGSATRGERGQRLLPQRAHRRL